MTLLLLLSSRPLQEGHASSSMFTK